MRKKYEEMKRKQYPLTEKLKGKKVESKKRDYALSISED